MKSITSPYDDTNFNEYLLNVLKKRLYSRCFVFTKDDSERRYYLDETDRFKYFTHKDIIESLVLTGKQISFSNQPLINYAVYDLSQRFWYDELRLVNNLIHKIYFQYQALRISDSNKLQPSKISHTKKSKRRLQEAKK